MFCFFNETVVLDSFFLIEAKFFSSFVLKKQFRKNSVFLIYFGYFWLNFSVLFSTLITKKFHLFSYLAFFISSLRLLNKFSGFLCLNLDIRLSFICLISNCLAYLTKFRFYIHIDNNSIISLVFCWNLCPPKLITSNPTGSWLSIWANTNFNKILVR